MTATSPPHQGESGRRTSAPHAESSGVSQLLSNRRYLFGSLIFVVVIGLLGVYMSLKGPSELSDARADWLVVSAATDGLDPWQDLASLARHYDVDYGLIGGLELSGIERTHPRTPGTLLLLRPLAELPAERVYSAMILVSSISVVVIALMVLPWLGWQPAEKGVLVATLAVGSAAYLGTQQYGTHSAVLLLSIGVSWLLMQRGKEVGAGLALSVAITLRLFPALLLIPMWRFGFRRAVIAAAVGFGVLNIAGLEVYGLGLSDAVSAVAVAGWEWMGFSGNASLAMPFVRLGALPEIVGPVLIVVGLAVAVAVSYRGASFLSALAVVLIVAVLSSPLSWVHYDMILFLAMAALFYSSTRLPKSRLVVSLTVAWFMLELSIPLVAAVQSSLSLAAILALVGRLVLLVAAVAVWQQSRDGIDRPGLEGHARDFRVDPGRHAIQP